MEVEVWRKEIFKKRTHERRIAMTRGDVFIDVMSELSGEPKNLIAEMLSHIKFSIPPELHRFDEEISDTKVGGLIDEMLIEKEAVLSWFIIGYRRFLMCTRMQQDNA
jgi:hypothetical protein